MGKLNCALDNKHIEDYVDYIRAIFQLKARNSEPFNFEDYIKEIYEDYIDKSSVDNKATIYNYIQITPYAILEAFNMEDRGSKLRRYVNTNLNLNDINDIADRWLENIDNTLEDLDNIIDDDVDYEAIKKRNVRRSLQTRTNPNTTLPSERVFVPRKSAFHSTTSSEILVRTPEELVRDKVAKNINEALKMYHEDGYKISEQKRGVLDPEMAVQATFTRYVLETLNTNLEYTDSRDIKKTAIKNGFYLTAMKAQRLPEGSLDSNTQRYLSAFRGSELKNRTHDVMNSTVLVVSDTEGDPLYFKVYDEDGRKKIVQTKKGDKNGKIIYYALPKPKDSTGKATFEYGKIDWAQSNLLDPQKRAKDISRSKPGSKKYDKVLREIEKDDKKQLEIDKKIHDYLAKDPKNNYVRSYVKGGSYGKVLEDRAVRPENRVNVRDLNLDGKETIEVISYVDDNSGDTLLSTPDTGLSKTNIYSRPIGKQEAEDIAAFLVRDVYNKAGKGAKLLTVDEKKEMLKPFLRLSSNGFGINSEKGLIEFTINDVIYKTKTAKQKEKAEKAVFEYFASPYGNEEDEEGTYKLSRKKEGKGATAEVNNLVAKAGISLYSIDSQDLYNANEGDFVRTGKDTYYRILKKTFNISKEALLKNDKVTDLSSLREAKDGSLFIDTSKPKISYKNWVINNTITYAKPNAEGKITTYGSYLNASFMEEDIDKKPVNVKEIRKKAASKREDSSKKQTSNVPDSIKRALDEIDGLDKTFTQKEFNAPVTPEQIEAARKWYPSHPMSKFVSFETAFNIANSLRPNQIANWSVNGGIILYKGSDYTDVYHEAWHAFSQMFLTKEQKTELYKETRGLSGTFTNLKGNTVSFTYASPRELEEYLGERFREYMLSDGKMKIAQPVRNKIFQFILDLLKSIFEGVSLKSIVTNRNASNKIAKYFEQLRVGDISEYTFDQANASFTSLDKSGISAVDETDKQQNINYGDSKVISDTMDVFLAQFADATGKNATKILKNKKASQIFYKHALKQFDKKREAVQTEFDNISKDLKKLEKIPGKKQTKSDKEEIVKKTIDQSRLEYNLNLLEWSISNFGSIDDATQFTKEINEGKGVIVHYLNRSRFLMRQDRRDIFDELLEDEAAKRDHHKKNGNENSLEYLASPDIVIMMRSIYTNDSDKNILGERKFENDSLAWNVVAKVLENTSNSEDMYKKMMDNSYSNVSPFSHIFEQLVQKLGDPMEVARNLENRNMTRWWEFRQAFDKIRIALSQVNINKHVIRSEDEETGRKFVRLNKERGYEITTGEVSGRREMVKRAWENNFKSTTTKHRKISSEGNYLDIASLMEDPSYVENGKLKKGKELDFLAELGVNIVRTSELVEQFTSQAKQGRYGVNYLFKKLKGYYQNEETDKLTPKSVKEIYEDEDTRYNILADVQAKYDPAAGFMQTTAEGSTQFEHSLHSSATKTNSGLNNSKNWADVMGPGNEYLHHLNPYMGSENIEDDKVNQSRPFNFMTRGSILLNTLYDFEQQDGPRREYDGKYIEIIYKNHSGISLQISDFLGSRHESGVSAADADKSSKILGDLIGFMQIGLLEGSRTSDRSTTMLYGASHLIPKVFNISDSSGKYYIDPGSFMPTDQSQESDMKDITGVKARDKQMVQYISNELARINYMKSLDKVPDAEEHYIMTPLGSYSEVGKNWVIFDDVLSPSTKKKLEKFKYNPEENLYNVLEEKNQDLLDQVRNDLEEYFDKQIEDLRTEIEDNINNEYIRKPLFEALDKNIRKLKVKPSNSKANTRINAILHAQIANSWINMFEGLALYYGDLAQYGSPDDFIKRITGATSPGLNAATDKATIEYFRNLAKVGQLKPYLKSKWFTERKHASSEVAEPYYDGTLNTAVMEDSKVASVLIDKYTKVLEYQAKKHFKNTKDIKGKSVINDMVKAEIKAYTEMDEGDGQGWITFDSYRMLKKSMGEWGQEQDALYEKVLSGKQLTHDEIIKFFPVAKYQYFGPLKINGATVTAFHKFSLMPLIPSVIKDTDLEVLHNRMAEQGMDYALFKSGSKLSNLTSADREGKADAFKNDATSTYSDVAFKDPSYKFTKNVIFIQYLKDQMAVPDEYKNKTTFSTQLRTIVESGLMEFGVPTDFNSNDTKDKRIKDWDKLDKDEREEKSANYRKILRYREKVKELTEVKKQELLRDVGITLVNGEYKGNINRLLDVVRNELSAQDISEHEISFIEFNPRTGKIKNDLSFSPSADKIERILYALVNKRLINQKVNGEPVVLVSGAGWQDADRKFTKPTKEQIKKYGTSGLSFYDIEINEKTGEVIGKRTRAMKVKIAMKGDFRKLLSLSDVIKKQKESKVRISRLDALNELIKDEKWLDKNDGENRKMITMVGVRIPLQALNSTEFMEVFEFLPEEAGSILIPPAEMVAKSGSDFDIDKLMVMMPNLAKIAKGEVRQAEYSEADIKAMWKKVKGRAIKISEYRDSEGKFIPIEDPLVEAIVKGIFGENYEKNYTPQEIEEILKEEGVKPYEQFRSIFMVKTIENQLMNSIVDILSLPSNFASLIRPNGTYLVKDIADDMAESVRGYDPAYRVHGEKQYEEKKGKKMPVQSHTRALELMFNVYKHQTLGVSKNTLGIGAVDAKYNPLLNGIGAYMSPWTKQSIGHSEYIVRQTIYLPHNKRLVVATDPNTGTKTTVEAVDISHNYDVDNQYNIGHLLEQITNGMVDAAKDPWIFDIQGNKEAAPVLLFALKAGVPVDTSIYLVSNPLVREYLELQRSAKSEFGDILGNSPEKRTFFRNKARGIILTNPRFNFKWDSEDKFYNTVDARMKVSETLKDYGTREIMTKESLYKRAKQKSSPDLKFTDVDAAAFLQYLELEDMAKGTTDLKMSTNFDTKKSTSGYAVMDRISKLNALLKGGRVPADIVEKVLSNSPIGSFNIMEFSQQLWQPLFSIRNHPFLNEFIKENTSNRDVEETFGENQHEKFVNQFKNDLISYIYQNSLKKFDLSKETHYKGYLLDRSLEMVQPKDSKRPWMLPVGAFVKDNKMYIDDAKILKDWTSMKNNKTTLPKEYKKYGFADVKKSMFSNIDEYRYFVIERAYLYSVMNISSIKGRADFNRYLEINKKEKNPEDMSYHQVIRDMALDNTFNIWKIFRSNLNNTARELDLIKEDYPELVERYPVLSALVVSESVAEEEADSIKNIRLAKTNLSASEYELYHDNLLELSNEDRIKEGLKGNLQENARISDFFRRLPYVAMLQSGISTNTQYALGRMTPFTDYTLMIKKGANAALQDLNNGSYILDLSIFRPKFLVNNSIENYNKNRYKNYYTTTREYYKAKKILKDIDKGLGDLVGLLPTQQQGSVRPKGFKLSIDKKGKDQGKADLANALITYPNSGTSSYQYMRDAKKQGVPVNDQIKPGPDVIAMVSVNGNNKATDKQIEDTYLAAREIIEAGGTVIMDSTTDANRYWNASGEALVQEQLGKPTGQTSKGYNYWGKNPETIQPTTQPQAGVSQVLEGDIFSLPGIPVITTNLGGVHGAGLAQAAKTKGLIEQGDGNFKATDEVVQLPVKKKWSDSMSMNNNMKLLNKSLKSLVGVAKQNTDKTYLLPLAGLGHGEGSVEEILPLLIKTVQSSTNIKLVLPAEGVSLGRQGTVRKDATRENLPKIKEMLSEAGLLITTQPQAGVDYNYNPSNVSEEIRNSNKKYTLDKLGKPTSISFESRDGDTLYRFTFADGTIIETPAKGGMLSYPEGVSEKIVKLSKEDPGYDIKLLIGLNKLAEETTTQPQAVRSRPFVKTLPSGVRVFDQSVIKNDDDAVSLAKENPAYIFVYDGMVTPIIKPNGTVAGSTDPKLKQLKLGHAEITNAIGVPLRLKPQSGNTKAHHVTDATLEKNIERIDEFLATLKDYVKEDGLIPVFPEQGIGQALIGADDVTGENIGVPGEGRSVFGLETYNHLSKGLLQYGYKNNNFAETEVGEELLMEAAPVTNKDVEDQMYNKCFL